MQLPALKNLETRARAAEAGILAVVLGRLVVVTGIPVVIGILVAATERLTEDENILAGRTVPARVVGVVEAGNRSRWAPEQAPDPEPFQTAGG